MLKQFFVTSRSSISIITILLYVVITVDDKKTIEQVNIYIGLIMYDMQFISSSRRYPVVIQISTT